MAGADGESLIKVIIGEIVQKCSLRGQNVSETLVAFMVKAVVMDPRNRFNPEQTLTNQDIQRLEEVCLDKLMEKCSPSLSTIKMQVYFDTNYLPRREFLEEKRRLLESRLSAVTRDITDSKARTQDQLQALYAKIISYILVHSGTDSPGAHIAMQEAAAALQSVFPASELGAFVMLLKKEKEQKLRELAMIVTGIRLFNNVSKRTEDQLQLHHLSQTKRLEDDLSVSQRLVWKYTTVLEKLMEPGSQSAGRNVPVVLLIQALYNVTQHRVYLQVLQANAHFCANQVEILQTELVSRMKLLKETVQPKRAAPAAAVFPLFKAVSQLWSGLKDEADLLTFLADLAVNLQPFITSQAKLFSEAFLSDLLGASQVKTDEQRMTKTTDERMNPAEMEQEWLLPETGRGFNQLPLQYGGFCGYTLVSTDGILLPGNPHIGVLKHKDKLYAFSSKDAAVKFASRPDDFIAAVEEKAKCSPELIQLLRLQQFSSIVPYCEMQSAENPAETGTVKAETGTQTETHPVETNIVKSYEWNEWELRRRAVKLANLRTKATHSTQTDVSHMRRENVTQTFPHKDAACQSKVDGGSSMPRPQVYLSGLRGQKDEHMVKTNLTRSAIE
ncbi:cilia- and flagella-associated protein 206-like isoform X2 [Thalassophryne amazonica]|uniref:cilia- and flagella-associated protein 206-like isoform X2 n=1 Tax=Thalassophryne amazonica TaxID=390379 RepID=UPI00147197F0|nr:cilia- and flagella-associated protein 206-like isoform X2 [Thalassophryne amazonica]